MNEDKWDELIVSEEEAGKRLDKVLADRFSKTHSRSYFQHLIDEKAVLLNGDPVKKRVKLEEGDEIEVCFILTKEIDLEGENIPLDIVFEDEHILVVNKPAGLVVHPAPGNWTGTFVNALLYHCKSLGNDSSSLRPGIVHRLDKDTSGLLLSAKTSLAQQRLIEMFANRQVHKEYLAICIGNPGNQDVRAPIGRHLVHRKKMCVRDEGGRAAHSRLTTLGFDEKLSVVRVILETGRTHQIRVHMQHIGFPVLGDAVYGSASLNKKYGAQRQQLHARRMAFAHPITGILVEFVADLPKDLNERVKAIAGDVDF